MRVIKRVPELNKSRWYDAEKCTNCKKFLSRSHVMYSSGRCPKCGYKGPYANTIVDTISVGYRFVYNRKWWQFWIKPEVEYRD